MPNSENPSHTNTPGTPRQLSDKLVLITGGASGLGLECARNFIEKGATVLIVGRSSEKLQDACISLNAITEMSEYQNSRVHNLSGDVRKSDFAQQAVNYANQELQRPVDILINNAGTILRQSATDTDDEQWQEVMDVNVNGVFFFSRAVAKQMTNGGAIVNISSTCGQVGSAGLAAYCASKGAVNLLTKSMALELAERKINVNAVAPGAINSPMLYSKHAQGVSHDSVVAANLAAIPIGELAEPAEVARAVVFLATEKHITGEILAVDGGYTAQ